MRRLAPLLPVFLILYSYWGAWNFDFLSYDDPDYVTANPVVRGGLDRDGIRWAFTSAHAANWHPLTWISHMLDSSLFGDGPTGPHTVNLLLHLGGTLLLFACLGAMKLPMAAVLLVSCVYAAHPTRLESVVWIAERKEVLSAVFGWLSLWAHLRYVSDGRSADRWLSVLALAVGLLAKPMLVSWPLLLFVVDRFLLERDRSSRALLLEKWPHFAVAVGAGIATLLAQSAGGAMRSAESIGIFDRAANAMVALIRYPWALLWPENLSFFYPHPALIPARGGHAGWLVALAAAAVATIALSCVRARRGTWTGGWLLYFVCVLPVLGLVQVGPQAWADRYMAIPGVGLSLAMYFVIARYARGTRPRMVLIVAIACAFAARTRAQLGNWSGDDALYARAITVTRDNWLAHSNLGQVLAARGREDEALAHFESAVRAKPDDAISLYNLGSTQIQRGRLREAETLLRAAIASDPRHAMAHNNLAQCLARQSRYVEALPLQLRAVELSPDDPDLTLNLADLERMNGATGRALERIEEVASSRPAWPRPYDLLARILFETEPQHALEFAARAVELDGATNPVYLETLAQCQLQAGQIDAARATAARALPLADAAGQRDRAARLRALVEDPR